MSLELIATGLVMGLAGAGHCAVMCGALCAGLGAERRTPGSTPGSPSTGAAPGPDTLFASTALAAAPGGGRTIVLHPVTRAGAGAAASSSDLALPVFLASRVLSYSAGGALVAASVSLLASLGGSVSMLRPFWLLLHVAVLLLGLWLLVVGRQPPALVSAFEWLQGLGAARRRSRPAPGLDMAHPAARSSMTRAALAGSAWVAMPCGLLQSALVTASLASTPLAGAGVMAAFALASSLGLLGAPALLALLRRWGGAGGERWVTRLAGALLAGAAGWALWMIATASTTPAVCVA